jgi:GTP pyrophosphokinase
LATSLQGDFIPGWSADDPSLERLDVDLLARAYRFSAAAHEGQFRRNGDPFVTHCVQVAKILADLQLDSTTVAAGLIHDVVEDTAVTIEAVEKEFGVEMKQIVDGLTKIGVLPLHSTEERQVENYRKLLVSIAKDARVIIIKLADRLHNMRTLDSLAEDKQRRKHARTNSASCPSTARQTMHRRPKAHRALGR